MPRLLACNFCQSLTKVPDVPPGTPMVPARLEWTSGEEYTFRDDDGNPVLVPKYDPVLEDFIQQHSHGRPDEEVLGGGLVRVWAVDQKTWDAVDITTKVKTELQKQTGMWYEDRDYYREEASACYNAHGNPTIHNRCKDFESDDKLIGKKTYDADGVIVTIPKKYRQYLCYQCPYFQSEVITEVRWRSGGYAPGSNKRTRRAGRHQKPKVLSYEQASRRIKKNRSRGK